MIQKPIPGFHSTPLFPDTLKDSRISCSQSILQDSLEVQKNGSSLSEIFTKS